MLRWKRIVAAAAAVSLGAGISLVAAAPASASPTHPRPSLNANCIAPMAMIHPGFVSVLAQEPSFSSAPGSHVGIMARNGVC